MPLVSNDKGNVLYLADDKQWKPAKTTKNDKGDTAAFDGKQWNIYDGKQWQAAPQTGNVEVAPSTMADIGGALPRGIVKGAASFVSDAARGEQIESQQRASAFGDTSGGINNKIPTGEEMVEGLEKKAGVSLKPKTTGGKIVERGGEFIGSPLSYLGPGGWWARALQAGMAGMGSEIGGELTKGTAAEPYARFVGGVAGGGVPSGAVRAVSPIASTAERQAAVAILENEGITAATAGQRTGNKALKYTESYLGDAPGAGARATQAAEDVGRQFTRAALQRAGENADLATPQVIDGAFTRIGGDMNNIAARNNPRMDAQFAQEMNTARDEYHSTVQEGQRRAVVDDVLGDFFGRTVQSPVITGEQFQRFRSRLTTLQRSAFNDPEYSHALGNYIEAMDGMLERSITHPEDLAALQQARRQYRNLIPLANASIGAGEQAAEGIITPSRLRTVLTGTQRGKRDYARGRGDFAELTRAGNLILPPLPNSGTAQRGMVAGIAGATGAAGTLAATGRYGEAAAVAASAAAPGVAGRALMTPAAQGYLANQAAVPLREQFSPAQWRALQSALAAYSDSPLAQPGQ